MTVMQSAIFAGTVNWGITSDCNTVNPNFTPNTTPTGGVVPNNYSYQWQSSSDGTNFSDINNADHDHYDPGNISQTTYYKRIITSGGCRAENMQKITVYPLPTLSGYSQATFCVGSGATINFMEDQIKQ
jgi:hypothetical protein